MVGEAIREKELYGLLKRERQGRDREREKKETEKRTRQIEREIGIEYLLRIWTNFERSLNDRHKENLLD